MSRHVVELLPDYASGALDASARAEVDAHVATCRACAAELRATAEVFAALALALPPAPPPAELKRRILATIAADAHGRAAAPGPFARFAVRISELMDVSVARAREVLSWTADATRWQPGPVPGSRLIHLDAGPAVGPALVGLVACDPGVTFPYHRHIGKETIVVLAGTIRTSDGSEHGAGDEVTMDAGTSHDFVVTGTEHHVHFVVIEDGLDFPSNPGFQV